MEKTGHVFSNKALLLQALTHSSFSAENNERLEFLGDAVLEFVSSTFLYEKYPDMPEGFLTKKRASLVCEQSLAYWAEMSGLPDYLRLGKSEIKNGGREKKSITSDAAEAVIGAVYLDGGIEAAKKLIFDILSVAEKAPQAVLRDSKSALQELLQKNGNVDISYVVDNEEGPPHDRTFHVSVTVNGKKIAAGSGKSKKSAEQDAAKNAMGSLDFGKLDH